MAHQQGSDKAWHPGPHICDFLSSRLQSCLNTGSPCLPRGRDLGSCETTMCVPGAMDGQGRSVHSRAGRTAPGPESPLPSQGQALESGAHSQTLPPAPPRSPPRALPSRQVRSPSRGHDLACGSPRKSPSSFTNSTGLPLGVPKMQPVLEEAGSPEDPLHWLEVGGDGAWPWGGHRSA